MTDKEFADWLGSVPREIPPEQVAEVEKKHDRERGLYVPHSEITHVYGEAQH
jgi:tRNA(Phe) wybutosine-synthesizing methylase Tyw3